MSNVELSQVAIGQIAQNLAEEMEHAMTSASLRHIDKGDANLEAGQITAATNILAVRLLRLGVSEQDAVNALVTTMRALKKELAAQEARAVAKPRAKVAPK